jgi:hypothetical protein
MRALEIPVDFVILLSGFGMVVSRFLDIGFYLYSRRFVLAGEAGGGVRGL